ncbi:hypothetical protein LP420_01975 [Massilia sp. B-10]|nr:hypothetical protein LP420_01975 [Massilia sp. B-10]
MRISDTQASWQSVRRDLALYALWKFSAKDQLRVSVSNLLAQDEVSDSIYADPVRGSTVRRSVTPGDPSMRVALEMKF